MNLNPATVLDPVFHFLDWIIAEWGVYLFLAFVWLSLLVLAWVFSGGLRRKFPNQPHVSAGVGIILQLHRPPPSPPPMIGIDITCPLTMTMRINGDCSNERRSVFRRVKRAGMGEEPMPAAIAAESFQAHERLVSGLGPKLACALEANLVLTTG